MYNQTPLVYVLLLRQYEWILTNGILAYIFVYLMAALLSVHSKKVNFWVLLIGLVLLILMPFAYRFGIWIYYLHSYK